MPTTEKTPRPAWRHTALRDRFLPMFFALISFGGISGFLLAMPFLTYFSSRPEPLAPFFTGVIASLVAWGGGVALASLITRSENVKLFGILPLTPSKYLWLNVRGLLPALLVAFVAVPLFASALVLSEAVNKKWTVELGIVAHLLVFMVLSIWLCLLIPLFEVLTGERWTRAFFFLRVVVLFLLRWPKLVLVLFFSALAAVLYSFLNPDAIAPLLQAAAQTARHYSPFSELLHYLASPFSALPYFAEISGAHGQGLVWIESPLFLFVGYLVWHIVSAARRPVETLEEQIYEQWTAQRESVEARQSWEAWLWRATTQSRLPKNLEADTGSLADGASAQHPAQDDEALAAQEHEPLAAQEYEALVARRDAALQAMRSAGLAAKKAPSPALLDYDETLTPEEQAVRHERFWMRPARFSWLKMLLAWPLAWVLAWWMSWLFHHDPVDTRGPLIWKSGMWLLCWLLLLAHATAVFQQPVELAWRNSPWPMRWRALFRALFRVQDYAQWFLTDLFAALFLTLAMDVPFVRLPWVLVVHLLLRLGVCLGYRTMFAQPRAQASSELTTYSGGLVVLGPMWLVVCAALFHPAMAHSRADMHLPFGLKIHAVFFTTLFDPWTMKLAVPVWIGLLVTVWAAVKRHERKWGDVAVSAPDTRQG